MGGDDFGDAGQKFGVADDDRTAASILRRHVPRLLHLITDSRQTLLFHSDTHVSMVNMRKAQITTRQCCIDRW